MNGDLISRAKAIAMHIAECSGECDCCKYITKDLECGILHNVPAVDAEPVRHAKWIGGELGYCSACKHKGCASDIWSGVKGNGYCPNCGAKMYKEE